MISTYQKYIRSELNVLSLQKYTHIDVFKHLSIL